MRKGQRPSFPLKTSLIVLEINAFSRFTLPRFLKDDAICASSAG
jgi:hypothetical protein